MSTIKVNNLQNVSGSSSSTPEQIHAGRAKAWVNCDASGNISSDYNVSTVGDNGTGDLTVNFDTDLADTNYCMTGGGIYPNGPGTGFGIVSIKEGDSSGNPDTKTVSACRVKIGFAQPAGNSNNTIQVVDTHAEVYFVFHGN